MSTSVMEHKSGRQGLRNTRVFITTGEKAGFLIDLACAGSGTLLMLGQLEYFCLGNAGWIGWNGDRKTPAELANRIHRSRESLNLVHDGS